MENRHSPFLREFILRPSRSLTGRGKPAFYGGIFTFGIISGYLAIQGGAWPIAVFLAAAIAGAAIAMILNTRSGREYERICLAPGKVEIYHYKPGFKHEACFEMPPYMLRVETVCDDNGHCEQLLLKARNKIIEIGAFLPPDEKKEVAQALKKALTDMANPGHKNNS